MKGVGRIGMDVLLGSTHICVLDEERSLIRRGVGDTHREMIFDKAKRRRDDIELLGLETGACESILIFFGIICGHCLLLFARRYGLVSGLSA